MRHRITSLVMCLAACCPPAFAGAAPTATPQPTASPRATQAPSRISMMAPADKYFGPFGMSPLSIRSTIGFLGRQYHYRTITDHDLLRKALMTEDALRRWRTAYPADPWLAPTFFHLEQLYQAVQTDEARKHATAILKDTIRYYPDTKEGHLSRARLAAGFPALVPETPVVAASPAPTSEPAAAAADPAASPAASMAPDAGASPTPGPSPTATTPG